MQSHSVQTWVGCLETISLARAIPLQEREQVHVLSEESPLRLGLPPHEIPMSWRPGSAEDVSIASVEESSVAPPPLTAVQGRDYPVTDVTSEIEMAPDLSFHNRSAQPLWNTATPASENEPEMLRVSPETPTEIKYRIWMQPMTESPRLKLRRAPERPCPAVTLPGLEALAMALQNSHYASDVSGPGVQEFAVQGLTTRGGTSLQSAVTLPVVEKEHMLYPGSQRLPVAALSAG